MSNENATTNSDLSSGKTIKAAKSAKPAKAAPKGNAKAAKPAKAAPKGKGKGKPAKSAKPRTLAADDGRYNAYRFAPDMRITLKAKELPYREGSNRHAGVTLALKSGTVGKFLAALAAKKQAPADGHKYPFDFLREARREGVVAVK
jgi:hypothetical protein